MSTKGTAATTTRTDSRVWISGQVRRVTASIRREMKRRAAVEPVIGHVKAEHRMDRNYLKGRVGDRINAVLAAAGYNFGLLLRWLAELLRAIIRAFAETVRLKRSLKSAVGRVLHGGLYSMVRGPKLDPKNGPGHMARKKLSPRNRKLSPGDWHDIVVPGLILRVGAKRQTWTYRYSAGGKKLRLTLGYHPALGLAEAREACRKASERIDGGVMPAAPSPHPRSADALTLGSLLDRYEAMRVREGQRIKALPKAMRQLRLHLKPWLGLPAGEFTKADLRAMRDKLIDAGTATAANLTLASLGPVMRWASEEDLIRTKIVPAVRRSAEIKARARPDQKGNRRHLARLRKFRRS